MPEKVARHMLVSQSLKNIIIAINNLNLNMHQFDSKL